MKILIIGAGPTGLTAALECARRGIIPEIVDAKSEPSKMSRAVGILPRSIEILNRTGVGDLIVEEGVLFKHLRIQRGSTPLIDLDISTMLQKHKVPIGLPQDRTESLMSKRLEEMGVVVQYNTKIRSVSTSEHEASAVFENGSTKTYDWIIGADGVFSATRKSIGIAYNGYELEEDWSIADIELADEDKLHMAHGWLIKGEREERDALVMIPIAPGRVRLVSSTPDSLAMLPMPLDIKKIRRSGTFKISIRQAEHYVKGRVVLAGDAAHVHSPVGGRGMNLGIDDAQAAITAILDGTLKKYEVEQKKKAKKVIRGTELVRKALVSNNPLIIGTVGIFAWLVQNIYPLKKMFIQRIAEL